MASLLIVENGSFVDGANSYVTGASIVQYAALRGVIIPNGSDPEVLAVDILGIKAMDFLGSRPCWIGEPVEPSTQALPWPRKCIVTGDTAAGYEYTIPGNLQNAQRQLALDVFNGVDITPSAIKEAQVSLEKVGPITTEFFELNTLDIGVPQLTVATALLAPLECGQGAIQLTINRR